MEKLKVFLKRKDIVFSRKRYLLEAMSAMTLGLFSSLVIGLIFRTLGEQLEQIPQLAGFAGFLIQIGARAASLMGPAIGVAVAWGLKAPPLVLFSSVVTGSMGAVLGGPAGAFVAAAAGAEFGKAVSRETRVDIIVTPATTLTAGMLAAMTVGPAVDALMSGLGAIIMNATDLQPVLMGIIVSVVMGLVLTAPISSAALAIMLGLSGLAAGAATVGCSAQMIGFAVISFKANGIGGFFAQGVGTSMLQIPNIIKNPWILLPPTLAGAILGPIATAAAGMQNIPEGAGMGTSGLVGQIGTITAMGLTGDVLVKIFLLHMFLPAVIALLADFVLRKTGRITSGDYLLEV
jgi:uncharacterized membrane protein